MFKDYIVLLHAIKKKTKKVPEDEKIKARKRMLDFQLQFNENRLKLNKI